MTEFSFASLAQVSVATCTWTIYNWDSTSNWTENMHLTSKQFWSASNEHSKWCLEIYPTSSCLTGYEMTEQDSTVIFFLCLASSNVTNVRAQAKLFALNGGEERMFITTMPITTFEKAGCRSKHVWPKGVLRSTLKNSDGTQWDDSITIMCEVSEFSDNDYVDTASFISTECDLVKNWDVLFTTKEWSDVIINVNGQINIKAHKLLLAARSPVFAAMFRTPMAENNKNCIEIKDTDPKVIEEMLRFIYTGKVNNIDEKAIELFAAADKYDLKRLKQMCKAKLCAILNVKNAAQIFTIADHHNCEQLKALTQTFIRIHIKDVMKTEGYISMIESHSQLFEEI